MRNTNLMILSVSVILAGCGKANIDLSKLSSINTKQQGGIQTPSNLGSQSDISVDMTQRYLYAMHDGLLQIVPIDPTTGELIQVVMGNWLVKPVSGVGDFYTMAMNPNGKMIYALMRNTQTGSKIYQYTISDVAYSTYGTGRPLTDTGVNAGTSNPGLFSWGNNGNLFLQNFNYTPDRVDSYTPNASTSILSSLTTVGSETTATVTYALSFTRVSQVGFDDHSYQIDSSSNHILHYKDSVLQSSADIGAQAQITDLALH